MKTVTTKDLSTHPCFNAEAKGRFGRVHLPVAPRCNIKCNFCDRKYDCVNESRPGVTSTLLSPQQAGIYIDRVLEREPRITVAGIAGPGDPFANGELTMATLREIKRRQPELLLCLSSNGMGIGPYIEELAELEVSHVTITVCAVDPRIGGEIYTWVSDGSIFHYGAAGAALLLERQKMAITRLGELGITVKVNCIVIPTVNDHHVIAVAREMARLGADLFNCIAMFPNLNTPFGGLEQPDRELMRRLRTEAEAYLPQMRHCTRCRADAVGLLGEDRSEEFRSCLRRCASPAGNQDQRPYIAVASQEGILINQHLGAAESFSIWERREAGFVKVDERQAPDPGGGIRRWHRLAKLLGDCRAVLISGIGPNPHDILKKSGIIPIEASGFIEDGLEVVFQNGSTGVLRGRRLPAGMGPCSGGGGGCG